MDAPFQIPFYAKISLIFISIFAFVYIMYIGQDIIIPIVFATLVAILLNPLVNYLVSKKLNRIFSISIAVALALFVVLIILYIISSQITMISETYPQLKEKFDVTSKELIQWYSEKFSIRKSQINLWIKETQSDAISNFSIGDRLSEIWKTLVIGMLLPVYLFMILFYKPLLLEFIRRLFKAEYHTDVAEVLLNSKKIVQSYLVGLFLEMAIVAALNCAGLLLLGIDYAIILGITGAILNIIPYIGGMIAIALPMIIAFATKDSASYPFLVLLFYIVIQFIDNHYIIPKIVAARVQINALISVIVVLIGGAIWGIPGMFLSIPLTAIIKIVFDNIESLKPYGFLLGNIVPTTSRFSFLKIKRSTS
jgi:predicted PurR-regulated permease PerM